MKVKHATDADDDIESIMLYQHFESQITQNIHHFYISARIQDPSYYIDMIHILLTASDVDTVIIHINCNGGNLFAGAQIVNAIQASSAHIVSSLEGEASSLATMVFLSGDEFVVHDHSFMMFHNYSYGSTLSKGHEQEAALLAMKDFFKGMAEKVYAGFITEDELDRIQRGEDLYMQSHNIRTRLNKMVDAQKAKLEEQEAAKKPKRTQRRPRVSTKKSTT